MSGSAHTSIDFWVLLANGFILYTAVKMNILSMWEWDVGMFFPSFARGVAKIYPKKYGDGTDRTVRIFLGFYFFLCFVEFGTGRFFYPMMTSANWNIFRVTRPLRGEPVDTPQRVQWRGAVRFSLTGTRKKRLTNGGVAVDDRRHDVHETSL